jgi:soluble lytic murein transglycosylase-like protein
MRASIKKQRTVMAVQREAARKQAENMGTWLPAALDLPPPVEAAAEASEQPCEPVPEMILAPIVDRASRSQNLDPKLLRAVIRQESAFRACAVSAKGAQGLMQLMPETAGDLGLSDPFDPAAAGPGAVDGAASEAGGIAEISETRDCVTAILQKLSLK